MSSAPSQLSRSHQKALDAYRETGSYVEAAKKLGITPDACRGRVLRAQAKLGDSSYDERQDPDALSVESTEDGDFILTAKGEISSLEELLTEAKIDPDDWLVQKWIANKWDAMTKRGPVPMWQVKAWLERKPDWLRHPVKAVKHLKRQKPARKKPPKVSKALIVPDSQNGYHLDHKTGYLDPLHDRLAWDLSVQMAEELQPDTIVLLGDMLDLAPWSLKFPRSPSLRYTTQPSILELHWWLGQLRLAAPKAQIVYLEGNHEHRIDKVLIAQADEMIDLRPADDPDGHPLMSVPRMLALDDLDIEYIAPYQEEFWLFDKVRVHHGHVVRAKGGATVAAIVRDASHSEIVGHVHRVEYASKTISGPNGQEVIFAMTPGTITRTDGVVPAASPRVDWQQGLGIVTRDNETGVISASAVPIQRGQLMWRGEVLRGEDRVEEIENAINRSLTGR